LQWEAIQLAKKYGCTEYDLFGTAPNSNPGHPMHGLYRFKSGFGGKAFHRMGCWDYPIDIEKYEIIKSHEFARKGYYIN
jgi:lipid II:glycine glycyltransferase (peptidoglycan interpeptide bridge formation enzyme)